MRFKSFTSLTVLCLLFCYACNPDCENYARVSATITPKFTLPGKPVLIATNPANFLTNRSIYIDNVVSGELRVDESTKVSSPTDYSDVEGGHLVTLPEGIDPATANYYVRDNDCGGFIPLVTSFSCPTMESVSAEVRPKIRMPGEEVLIATNPGSFLKDKDLYFQKRVNGQLTIGEETKLAATYREDLGGSIVSLPMDAEGIQNFFVKNEECGGFFPLNNPITVADDDFINNNLSLFVSPAPAQIIIPTIPTVSPTNMVNTWFSPNNRDYCIWLVPDFVPLKNAAGETVCYQEKETLTPANVAVGPGQINSGSWELKAWCEFPKSYLFDGNPITGGIIDTLTGYVTFTIDRTSKGLGVEVFEGTLMTPTSVPEEYRLSGVCEPGEPAGSISSVNRVAKTMMVVNSKETGRQLVLFRFDVVGLGFHEKNFCKSE